MNNLTLIGMSGSGKSTVGQLVAQQLGWCLYDVDYEMEVRHGKPLQDILDQFGDVQFLEIQEQQVLETNLDSNTVVSPGGSVVYSPEAMTFLKEHSTVVYLEVDLQTLLDRLTITGRGIVGLQDKTFAELHAEREVLYKRYADVTINTTTKVPEVIAADILKLA